MRGKSVTPDQLDALAAFVLGLPDSDPESTANFVQPPEPDPAILTLIATGRSVFFGKGLCSTCHAGADLSNHKITTNQVHLTFQDRRLRRVLHRRETSIGAERRMVRRLEQ